MFLCSGTTVSLHTVNFPLLSVFIFSKKDKIHIENQSVIKTKLVLMDTGKLLEETLGGFGRWHGIFVFLIYLSGFIISFHALLFIPEHYNMDSYCSTPNVEMCSKECEGINSIKTYMSNSMICEWHLVCGNTNGIIQTIILLGFMFGSVILGWCSDKFGRKIPMLVEIVVQIVSGVAAGFANNFKLFTVLRTISAFATGGLMTTTYILLIEGLDQKYRCIICIIFQITIYLSYAFLALSCWFLRDWRHIQIFLSSLGVLLLPYIFLVHESVRWLLLKKRTEDLVNVLEKMAKCNNMPVESVQGAAQLYASDVGDTPPGNILDLFRTKRMLMKTLILCFNWFGAGGLYYAATNVMGHIHKHWYKHLILSGAVQLPGNLLCLLICEKFGRKPCILVVYDVAFIPLILYYILPKEPDWLRVVCGCFCLCGCAMCITVLYLYSAEVLPTVVRNFGMGFMLLFFWAGFIFARFIFVYLATLWDMIPFVIIGTLGIIVVSLDYYYLPESLNVTLPDTLEDADDL